MERRTALKLIAGGVIAEQLKSAQHHLVTIARAPAFYKLQFFSAERNELIDRLAEIIIPADERSGGAHEARVSLFIDLMVTNSNSAVQQEWRSGLAAVDAEAQRRHQTTFVRCTPQQQDEIVAAMAAGEGRPRTELERFFVRLKSMTVDGYYTSEIGIHRELKYKGNTVMSEFPGCTHPEHG